MAWNWEAKGHIAKVLLFDDETVFVPFSNNELTRLISTWRNRMRVLTDSGDYPEIKEDKDLYDNLLSAQFLLTQPKEKL